MQTLFLLGNILSNLTLFGLNAYQHIHNKVDNLHNLHYIHLILYE